MWRVRQRLLLLVIAALLPLIVLIGVLSFFSVSQKRAELRDDAIGYSAEVLQSVNRELQAQRELAEILARSPTLDAKAPALERFQEVATRFVAQVSGWDRVILSDASGQQVVNTAVPFGTPLPALVDPNSFTRALTSRVVRDQQSVRSRAALLRRRAAGAHPHAGDARGSDAPCAHRSFAAGGVRPGGRRNARARRLAAVPHRRRRARRLRAAGERCGRPARRTGGHRRARQGPQRRLSRTRHGTANPWSPRSRSQPKAAGRRTFQYRPSNTTRRSSALWRSSRRWSPWRWPCPASSRSSRAASSTPCGRRQRCWRGRPAWRRWGA